MKKMIVPLCLLFIAQGCIVYSKTGTSSEPVALSDAVKAVDRVCKKIQNDMDDGADAIADTGQDPSKIAGILNELFQKHPYAVYIAFINQKGMMQAVEPAFYSRKLQGRDIVGQEQIKKIFDRKEPAMSWAFLSREGYYVATVQYPVLDDDDVYLGSLCMLLRPESLLKNLIEPQVAGVPVDLWVMEPAGRIIYDPDKEEIGRNVFQDDLYKPFPSLLAAAHTIASAPQGMTTYEFLDREFKESVKKYAYWNTVTLAETPWRIVLIKAEKESVNGRKTLEELGLKELNQAFRDFVSLEEMYGAIEAEDKLHLLSLFEEFYSNNPGLYSVQWVDENCVARLGYPPGNSLSNYQFDPARDAAQIGFIEAVRKGRETFIETPLLEGNTGQMLLCPVKTKGHYRGMVYYIRIKP